MPDATDVIQLTDEINKKNSTKNVEPDIAAFVESQIEQHSNTRIWSSPDVRYPFLS